MYSQRKSKFHVQESHLLRPDLMLPHPLTPLTMRMKLGACFREMTWKEELETVTVPQE